MNNSFFSKLAPKEPKFYPLLSGLSEVIIEITEILIEFMSNYEPDNAEDYFRKIKEVERKGDRLTNKIFDELNISFITPFDREDINDLSGEMDDVNDFVNSAAKKIYLYRPLSIPVAAHELALNLNESSLIIKKSIDALPSLKKDFRKIKSECDNLHILENKADDIYEHFLIELFQNPGNPVEMIKIKEIMSELERATDVAERVGKTIKKIIVKYA